MSADLDGVVRDRQILDLTSLQTPEDVDRITGLENIEFVLVPASLAAAVDGIPRRNVEQYVVVPDGVRVRSQTGMLQVGGGSFNGPDAQNEFLVVLGALVFTTPVTDIKLAGIVVIGAVYAPIGSEDAVGGAITQVMGMVGYYRYAEGQQIKTLSGQPKLNGAALANKAGSPDDILIAAGQFTVTGPVTELGYRELVVLGQAILPRSGEDVLGPALQVSGQTIWYGGSNPRLFMGNEEFGRQFLELIEEPATFILFGNATFDADVTPELLREKVAEIVLFGTIEGPKSIVPVLQYLTTEKFGTINALEDSAGDAG
ncbi:MAG TPA: hypothetical protein VHX59_13070 [Mycobacteriales bacterium]|jgi:hypothetical protein|nr:hypothetical protein [Mycobacteriales bacterium]